MKRKILDIGTILGLVLGICVLLLPLVSNVPVNSLLDPLILLIVLGGTIVSLCIGFPIPRLIASIASIKQAFFFELSACLDTISSLVGLTERGRREGILSLESSLSEIEDPYLREALTQVIDRVEPELIKDILHTELAFIEDRHKKNQEVLTYAGLVAVAMGVVSLLVKLLIVLLTMGDAIAFSADLALLVLGPLYGALLALLFFSVARRLNSRTQEEILHKEIIIEGIMSVQARDDPRTLETKLLGFLYPSHDSFRRSLHAVETDTDR